MSRQMLNGKQRLRIEDFLPGKPTDKGGRAADKRLFVEAVLFIARTGCPWRDLPVDFGKWRSVYVRFARWGKGGVWARVAEALSAEADLEELFIDATIVRVHQQGHQKETVAIRQSANRAVDCRPKCMPALMPLVILYV